MKGMAWVRVLVGAVWLNGALEKLLNPDFPAQFADSLAAGGFVSQAPPFFRAFMEGVVAPNAEVFAQVVRLAELSLGLALVLGVLTNLGPPWAAWVRASRSCSPRAGSASASGSVRPNSSTSTCSWRYGRC
jgi:uncharacterized membrane protein YphA (DoxX/SURF4 family)